MNNNVDVIDIPYSNREIRERWYDLANSLTRIENQTLLTNGHVADINRWRERVNGGLVVSSLLVIPILAWALYVLVNVDGTVHQAVDDALSAYNINP